MTTLTITAKGQITLKKDVLAALGLRPGEKINVDVREPRSVVLTPARKPNEWGEIIGIAGRNDGKVLSIDEMNEIIAKGWAGQL